MNLNQPWDFNRQQLEDLRKFGQDEGPANPLINPNTAFTGELRCLTEEDAARMSQYARDNSLITWSRG